MSKRDKWQDFLDDVSLSTLRGLTACGLVISAGVILYGLWQFVTGRT